MLFASYSDKDIFSVRNISRVKKQLVLEGSSAGAGSSTAIEVPLKASGDAAVADNDSGAKSSKSRKTKNAAQQVVIFLFCEFL